MPVSKVTSIDDSRLGPYRNLTRSKVARQQGLFIAEGYWLVLRLLASAHHVDSILVDERRLEDVLPHTIPETQIFVAPAYIIDQILGFNFHRGVLACGRRREFPNLQDHLGNQSNAHLVLICVGVMDAENLGGIVRNAAAFGCNAVLIGPGCCDPYARRVLRVSMGTSLKVPLIPIPHLKSDLTRLRDDWGWQLTATVLHAQARLLEQAARPDRLALLLGSEGFGLPADVLQLCEQQVTIAMQDGVDSLNVAVASGIFLYHFTR